MGWILSVGSMAGGGAVQKKSQAVKRYHGLPETQLGGKQWRISWTSAQGRMPAWRAERLCQHVLSTLAGFD